MIIVGQPTLNASTGKVELIAPMGFGTARGVRLSNFTTDSLVLTNISGVDQSQEYLAPQTQMVYPTANVGATPVVVGASETASLIVEYLQVEWSTDPDNDFLGTYPAALPAPITTQATSGREIYRSVNAIAGGSFTVPFTVQTNDYSVIDVSLEYIGGYLPTFFYQWLDEFNNIISAGQVNTGRSAIGSSSTNALGLTMSFNVGGYYLQLMTQPPFTIQNVTVSGLINVTNQLPITVRQNPLATLTQALAVGVNVGAINFSLNNITATGLLYPVPSGVTTAQQPDGYYHGAILGGGNYTMQTSGFPTDTDFTISLSRNATNGIDSGTGYLLATSSDAGVSTVKTLKYLNKTVYVPPWVELMVGASLQSGIVVDILTASAGAYNLFVQMMPINGGSAGFL